MEASLYDKIKQRVDRGMSVNEACGGSGKIRLQYLRERDRRGHSPMRQPIVAPREITVAPMANLEYTPMPITPETLEIAENHLFGLLLEQIKRGDTRSSRMMLDLLKSRHPEYKERAGKLFTPDDYKEVWEKIKNGHAKNGNASEGEEVSGKTVQ